MSGPCQKPCGKLGAREAFDLAVGVVSRSSGMPRRRLLRAREMRAKALRHEAMYVATVGIGTADSLRRMAAAVGVHLYALQFALRAIEERRDDPRYDRRIERLEERARAAVRARGEGRKGTRRGHGEGHGLQMEIAT